MEGKLRDALAASHALAGRLDEPGFPLAEMETLQDWQRRRLARTYADLLAQKQFRAAGHFFLEELYGGLDFRERDREVEHVLPVMVRMLPEHMLESMVDAFGLQALSLELDMRMAQGMKESGWPDLCVERYGSLYRRIDRLDERRRQVALIHRLGEELLDLVRHRMVLRLVRFMRIPARAAGFGRLQGFLEEGLYAFREMRQGHEFIRVIRDRETTIMQRLARAEEDPFEWQAVTA